jgi:hypothetical protein
MADKYPIKVGLLAGIQPFCLQRKVDHCCPNKKAITSLTLFLSCCDFNGID